MFQNIVIVGIITLVLVGLYRAYRRVTSYPDSRHELSDYERLNLIEGELRAHNSDLKFTRENIAWLQKNWRGRPWAMLALARLGDATAADTLKSDRQYCLDLLEGKVEDNELSWLRYLETIGTPDHLPVLMRLARSEHFIKRGDPTDAISPSVDAIKSILEQHGRDCNAAFLDDLSNFPDNISWKTNERIFDPATDEWPRYEEQRKTVDCRPVKALARTELARRGRV
jgi:hypothetical protein